MLIIAALLLVLIGFIHSILGEKYILIRLFRRDNLPKLFGDDWFTKQTLRFAWHITSIAWWGFAALLFSLTETQSLLAHSILIAISVVFTLSGVIALIFSKAKHLSWVVFFVIALTSYLAMT